MSFRTVLRVEWGTAMVLCDSSLGEGPPLLLRQVLGAQDRPDGWAHYYLFSYNREEF